MHKVKLLAGLSVVLGCLGAASAAPLNITDGELALTPPYCQDVQAIRWGDQYSNTSPRAPYWVGLMGKTFWAMHHYCWALIHVHRSRAAGVTSQERAHMIHSAINDYYYVVNNSTPGFILLPEIFLRIGEAHVLLDAPVAALEAFAKARELKADYWPAYARAAEVLERVGKKTAARSLLGDGLRLMPDEPALQSAFKRLGGSLSGIGATPPGTAAAPSPSDSAAPR